jgi:hypothetical protein
MKTVIFTCLIGFTLDYTPVEGIQAEKLSVNDKESAYRLLVSMGYSNVEVFKLI